MKEAVRPIPIDISVTATISSYKLSISDLRSASDSSCPMESASLQLCVDQDVARYMRARRHLMLSIEKAARAAQRMFFRSSTSCALS